MHALRWHFKKTTMHILGNFSNSSGIKQASNSLSFSLQFGQVGVGNNLDQCSPVQVRFPDDQVCYLSMTPRKV